MKRYEIWSEGFADSRDSGRACLLGHAEGATFAEACMAFMNADKEHLQLRFFKGKELTYWGCRLFDNEADARKSFG